MSDDRSERLRQRRKQSQARVRDQGSSEPSEPSEPSQPDEQAETGDTAEPSEDASVKDEQVGTYMYLPKSQKKEIERLYNVLKAEYEYEFDEEFEKNRAFYPLLVQYGLEGLDGLDASELREHLDGL